MSPYVDNQTLACDWPGCCAVARYVVGSCDFLGGYALVIVGDGKDGNWMTNVDGEFCPEHWHFDEDDDTAISGPQTKRYRTSTPPLIERLGSEADLFGAIIGHMDPTHGVEVFDQYHKIMREIKSQAWKLGYAGGKAGFDPAANPYQDEEES